MILLTNLHLKVTEIKHPHQMNKQDNSGEIRDSNYIVSYN